MATLVAALGGVEFPREVDADTTGVIVLFELCADIDASIGCHLRVLSMKNIVGQQGDTEALVLQELLADTEPETASCFLLGATRFLVGCDAALNVKQPRMGNCKCVVKREVSA